MFFLEAGANGLTLSQDTQTALSGLGQTMWSSFEQFIPYAVGMAAAALLVYLVRRLIKKASKAKAGV